MSTPTVQSNALEINAAIYKGEKIITAILPGNMPSKKQEDKKRLEQNLLMNTSNWPFLNEGQRSALLVRALRQNLLPRHMNVIHSIKSEH